MLFFSEIPACLDVIISMNPRHSPKELHIEPDRGVTYKIIERSNLKHHI